MRSTPSVQSGAKRHHSRITRQAANYGVESLERRMLMASIVVDSTADTTANDGVTTLREAITTANGTTASDVITFNLGSGAHTINLGSALPTLTRPVQINGPGATLLTVRRNGSSNYRIFRTASDVAISGMTISNGRVSESMGGAVYNEATLTMNDCVLSGNQAAGTTASQNLGGAIYSATGAALTLNGCTISGNTAWYQGGGLYNLGSASITGCTFVDNTATTSSGGAIFHLSPTMTVTNSTFTRNSSGFQGNAIANASQATLTGCTITGNSGWGAAAVQGANYTPTPVTTLRNNIIALNEGDGDLNGSFLVSVSNPKPEPSNPWGDNFIGDWRYFDDRGSDPMLGPLADNGGPTQTMAPLPGSPVIDLGNNTYASPEDQRGAGFSRVSGPRVDYGAYEAQSVTVDNTGDQSDGDDSARNLTLREAVEQVNANPRIDIIRFADDVFSTPQTIDTTGLAISGELDIRGPGAKMLTIRGPDSSADAFDASSNLYLSDLTLQNRGQGAGIDNHNILSLRRVVVAGTGSSGPAIVTSGTSTVKYSTLMDNAGGGIINTGGSVSVYNSTLSRNSTAIRNQGGSLGLTFTTISGNTGAGVDNPAGAVSAGLSVVALNGAGDVVNSNGGTADLSSRDFIGTRDGDPMLLPLADNGGSTPTMALRPYSPCINTGSTAGSYILDQRGTSRSRISDIGAYEYTGPFSNSLVVTTTADEDNGSADPAYGTGTSLREAILYAGATPGTDVITFDLGSTPKVIQIASGELSVPSGITIQGPGADLLTIRGTAQNSYGVFSINQSSAAPSVGPVEISGLTLTNGKSYGIQIVGAMNVRVSDCVITGNGWGIYDSGGQLTMTRSTVSGNSSVSSGGGIYSSHGSVSIDSSTVSGNSSSIFGGGIYSFNGSVSIDSSTISGNSARSGGGAIYVSGGGATISRSTIANNTSSSLAGGIFNSGGNLTLNNTIVARNTGGDLVTSGTATYNATFSFIGDTQGDPLLGPLADNGGPTKTMALLPGSPCINAGDPSFTAPPDFDQRGDPFARVSGGRLDIGAFELNPPIVLAMSFDYNNVSQQSLRIQFSANVAASLSADDLILTDLANPLVPVDTSHLTLSSYNAATNTATFTFSGFGSGSILPDGDYSLDLRHTNISDAGGAVLLDATPLTFFFLNGDADHDHNVDVTDLGLLATNWQATGKTFAQGDFNYDGFVDVTDLGILATNWQKSLPSPAAPLALAAASPIAPASVVSRRVIDDVEQLDQQA